MATRRQILGSAAASVAGLVSTPLFAADKARADPATADTLLGELPDNPPL